MKPSVIQKSAGSEIRKFGGPVFLAALLLMCGIFVSCGDDKNFSPEISPPPASDVSPIGKDYSGKVVIKFKDGTDVRLASGGIEYPFTASVKGVVKDVNVRVTNMDSRVAGVRRVMTETEEEVTRWRDYWSQQGVETHDWNLVYYLDVPNKDDAVELVKELTCHSREGGNPECADEIPEFAGMTDIIEYVEILPVFYLTNVTTPDMSSEQGYLKSVAQGGLGIEDVWALGISGQGTTVVDQEYDWNFDHEILPIDETGEFVVGPSINEWNTWGTESGKGIANNIHHGTAVVGIIAGQGAQVNKAIKGISPSSNIRFCSMGGNGCGGTQIYADAVLSPGSVFTIEVQSRGVTTVASGCTVGDGTSGPIVTGCVPFEASNLLFNIVKDATATGAVIVEGAGNGSVNLNNDAQAAPEDPANFSHYNQMQNGVPVNDSGAIMVGASMGANKRKASWSNCGDRVDVFAWGAGVVTAGYGDHPASTGDINNPDNPASYTGQFGGTSAATAQVAGIAALVQSHVRKLVEDAGYVGRTVYLDSKQMRQVLKSGGAAAVYGQTEGDPNPNCNIGVQPNAVQAIAAAENFINNNAVKIVPLNANVVSGIRYDMDGDKKAELISFSRDHKWYIDLSTVGAGGDNFGSWDVILSLPAAGEGSPAPDAMLFPVVHDYNSDGRADLALYDSVNGKYYIKYTSGAVIASPQGAAISWDKVIDYSTDPNWKAYSRPLPGDINNDRWLDITFQTPDGYWLIDFGGFDGVTIENNALVYHDHFGEVDKADIKYLADTQLNAAPGWAWLSLIGDSAGGTAGGITKRLLIKPPDGSQFANTFYTAMLNDDGTATITSFTKNILDLGDSDNYFTIAGYKDNKKVTALGFKDTNGVWSYIDFKNGWKWDPFLTDPLGYGDILCRPIPADYDGDGKDDRAVQCGHFWKIVFSSNATVMSEVELAETIDPLPAFVYPGGIKYQDQVALFNYYKAELPCANGQPCTAGSTIYDVQPPIGPYFAECVQYWAPSAVSCWDK